MKILNIKLLIVLGVFLISSTSLSTVIRAEGWYAGIGTGLARYTGYNSDIQNAANQLGGVGFSTSGTTSEGGADLNLFGGCKFNPFFGLEGAYTYFNQATATLNVSNGTSTIVLNDTVKAYGISLSAVGTYPFNNIFSVYLKAGIDFWNENDSGTCTINGTPCTVIPSSWNNSANGTSPVFGGGASFSWNRNDSLRLGYNVFSQVGNTTTDKARDLGVISLDYIYSF